MELQASRVLKGKWTQQPALKDEVAVLLQVGEVEVNKGRRENGRKTRRAKRAAKFLDLQEKRSKFCLTTRGQKFHTALHCTEEGPEKSTLHCTALHCTAVYTALYSPLDDKERKGREKKDSVRAHFAVVVSSFISLTVA